jgi:hypothetical protein
VYRKGVGTGEIVRHQSVMVMVMSSRSHSCNEMDSREVAWILATTIAATTIATTVDGCCCVIHMSYHCFQVRERVMVVQ